MPGYVEYIRGEWNRFFLDPTRRAAALDAVAGLNVRRVLDIGCGAGQELTPFIEAGALGVGVDLQIEAGLVGRKLFSERYKLEADDGNPGPARAIRFVCAAGESLPFPENAFDAVVCRIALPYMDNQRALAEVHRIMRPGGVFLLRVHHPRYYLRMAARAAGKFDLHTCAYASRALIGGALYHLLGRQILRGLLRETFQTRWMLRRALRQMVISGNLPDSDQWAPLYVIRKLPETAAAEIDAARPVARESSI